jgi:hypothetical protein
MSYFKNTNPEALAAWDAQEQAKIKLRKESDALAEEFNGERLVSSAVERIAFYGIKLNNWHDRPDNILWTVPERGTGASWPRKSIKKRPEWTKKQFTEYKTQLEELKQRYDAMVKPSPIDRDPLWNAIGTSWGELLFAGISMFEHDGALFIKTDRQLEGCTEILGSEYDAAYAAMKSAEEPA